MDKNFPIGKFRLAAGVTGDDLKQDQGAAVGRRQNRSRISSIAAELAAVSGPSGVIASVLLSGMPDGP